MTKTKTVRLLAALMVPGLAAFAAPANAALVTWQYGGVVTSCPDTGIPPCGTILFVGDQIGGPFTADVTGFTDATIAYTDFVSFSTMVGNFFAVTSDNSALIDGAITTNANGQVSGGSLVILAEAIDGAPATRITLNLDANSWVAEVLLPDPVFIAKGQGGFKLAPVPLPGGFVLLAPVIALMAIRTRRRPAVA